PITHDPGKRISWTNRPPISLRLDTDKDHKTITTLDLEERNRLLQDGGMSWQKKRENMMDVCKNCHSPSYVDGFYQQYDSFIHLYNEKYGKPGTRIMKALLDNNIRTKKNFDDKIEWTWFYLWHHEGRRARHGASMMAPDYTHWHGTFEVAERWYIEFIPEAREMCQHAREDANGDEARIAQIESVEKLIDEIMATQHHDHARDVSKIRHPKEHAKEDSGEENPPGGG
ncbi:MAG: hypothetical protein OEY28_09310, partial [Nitrospira sp.]|nr:hypothetical protein [Nitrospira sp.]